MSAHRSDGNDSADAPESQNAPKADPDASLCIVCFEHARGTRLPCGHDQFCARCVQQFWECPLCRDPLRRDNHIRGHFTPDLFLDANVDSRGRNGPPEYAPFLSSNELGVFVSMGVALWLFIFFAGLLELTAGSPYSCDAGCEECDTSHHGCDKCKAGQLNTGQKCYESADKLPPVVAGAALHATTHLCAIFFVHFGGLGIQFFLLHRLWERRCNNVTPRWYKKAKLAVLSLGFLIQTLRICCVEAPLLRDFFFVAESRQGFMSGEARSYSYFRVPVHCGAAQLGWSGADGKIHCTDWPPYSGEPRYYVAKRLTDFSNITSECSVFGVQSAFLDYSEHSSFGGHERFRRFGWAVGGEAGLYYLLSAAFGAAAACIFVARSGQLFLARSVQQYTVAIVAFLVLQFGALAPYTLFRHRGCLHYQEPFGLTPRWAGRLVVAFGYCSWAFPIAVFPVTAALLVIFALLCALGCTLGKLAKHSQRCCGDQLASCSSRFNSKLYEAYIHCRANMRSVGLVVLWLALIPIFALAAPLASCAVVAQLSKQDNTEVLLMVGLIFEVLFKFTAFAVMDALLQRTTVLPTWPRQVRSIVIGRPEADIARRMPQPAVSVTRDARPSRDAVQVSSGPPSVVRCFGETR